MTDRFGLAWRRELAHGLYHAIEEVDVLEFLADDWLADPRQGGEDLRAWAELVPIHLHGTRLGLASAEALDGRLLQRWAELLERVRPAVWSEHLAVVGGGGRSLPHFAAPPRTPGGVAAIAANLARVRQVVGSAPLLENPASLMVPLASTLDEAAWLAAIATAGDGRLLLDLHNLHANAHNTPGDALEQAMATLHRLPIDRIAAVHLAGGRPWRGRLLDDHRHGVPPAVWDLLEELGTLGPGPLDVIIERDGDYPPVQQLLAEVALARERLAQGRRHAYPRPPMPDPTIPGEAPDQTLALQHLTISLLDDARLRASFIADPHAVGSAAGLTPDACERLRTSDLHGLTVAAASLDAKRERRR